MSLNRRTKLELKAIIEKAYKIPYTKESYEIIENYLDRFEHIVEENNFLNRSSYLDDIEDIQYHLDRKICLTGQEIATERYTSKYNVQ